MNSNKQYLINAYKADVAAGRPASLATYGLTQADLSAPTSATPAVPSMAAPTTSYGSTPTQPTYQGGQSMPAYGTAAYTQQFGGSSTPAVPTSVMPSATASPGQFGSLRQQIQSGQLTPDQARSMAMQQGGNYLNTADLNKALFGDLGPITIQGQTYNVNLDGTITRTSTPLYSSVTSGAGTQGSTQALAPKTPVPVGTGSLGGGYGQPNPTPSTYLPNGAGSSSSLPTVPTLGTTSTSSPSSVPPAGWDPKAWEQQQADMKRLGISGPAIPTVAGSPTGAPGTPPVYQGGQSMPALGTPEYAAQFGGGNTPAVPTNTNPSSINPTGVGGADSAYDPSATSDEILQQILTLMKPSADETSLTTEIANVDAAQRKSFQNIEGQPIAMPFVTGQEAAVAKQANDTSTTLQNRLAIMQAQRTAALDASKFALEAKKPVALSAGAALVDPVTGKTIAGSPISPADKQAMDTFYNLQQTYPDAALTYDPAKSWQDNLASAQSKVSGSASFSAKNSVYAINPLTGEPTLINKLGGGGMSNLGTSPGSAGGATTLDKGASGASVSALQNWLISQGYAIPAGATGYYGDQTAAAVAAFQRDHGVNTSSGGSGTFGPQTAAAAAARGLSLAGTMTQGGGAPSGGGNTASIPAELRSAITTLGNNRFFDQSKLNPAQLPYAQRASQASGIPILTKEDANKVQESYQQFQSANALVSQIVGLTTNVLKASNDPGAMTTQNAYLTAVEKAPYLFTDDAAKQFVSARNSILSLITRAAGEKGTLTDQDVIRITQALPSYGDNAQLATQKAQNLSAVLRSVFDGSISTYVGGAAGGGSSAASSGGANDPLGIR